MAHRVNANGSHESEVIDESASLLQCNPPSALKPPTSSKSRCTWPWIHVVALTITISIVVDIGEQLFMAPKIRLYESIACASHYLRHNPSLIPKNGSIPEELCKINPVQEKIAMIQGWQEFFDGVPALLLPVVYGHLADKYGRKLVAVLALLGETLSAGSVLFMLGVLHLPLEFVWLSSLFHCIGGGPVMVITLMTTIVADVAPADQRSSAFFYRFTSELIAECVVPPVASVLMKRTPWIPLIAAIGFMSLGTVMMFSVPETLPITALQPDEIASNNSQPEVESPNAESEVSSDGSKSPKKWEGWINASKEFFNFVTSDKLVVALLLAFLVLRVGRQAYHMFLQYVSKRYGWTIAKAGFLLSLRAGVNIVLFTAILPFIATFALSKISAMSRDLCIARVSIILMIVGTVDVASSPTPIPMIIGLTIYTFGAGFPPILRSLVTAVVESHHASKKSDIGRLYAVISVIEGVGSLIAGPGMAWIFTLGMGFGGFWVGLPFAVAAGLFAVVSQVVFFVSL